MKFSDTSLARESRFRDHVVHFGVAALLSGAGSVHGAEPSAPAVAVPAQGYAAGLADSVGLRATVFGTPPQNLAPMPSRVPLVEINIALPWARAGA